MGGLQLPAVYSLGQKDRGAAGRVLARAFHDTDQWSAVLPDVSTRQDKLEQMFTGSMKLTSAACGVAERTEGFEAVAIWLPPGRRIGWWPMVKSGFASARFAVTPPFPNIRRLMGMLRQFEQTHEQQLPGPHWYLMALGVDPDHERRAYGRRSSSTGSRELKTKECRSMSKPRLVRTLRSIESSDSTFSTRSSSRPTSFPSAS